jgi:hypothetical protein
VLAGVVAAGVASVYVAAPPARAEPCVTSGPGTLSRTLARLGHGELRFAGGRQVEVLSVPFTLPAGARQGAHGRWFLMRFHFRARVAPASGAGFVDVSALVNGRSGSLIELERRGGGVTWTTAGLVGGVERGRERIARTFAIRHLNYVQLGSIRGGRNRLSFRLEQAGGLRLERVTVLADSGIVSTRSPPPKLTLELDQARLPDSFERGRPIALGLTLENAGGCPVRNVEVGAILPRGAVESIGPRVIEVGRVAHEAHIVLRLRPIRSGTHRILVAANSDANHPGVYVDLPVRAHGRRWPAVVRAAGIVLLGAAVVLVALWRRARKKVRALDAP